MSQIDFNDCPAHGREAALHKAMNILHFRRGTKKPVFVETGSIRNVDWRFSDGYSTLLFGWYCKKYDGELYTLEISEDALSLCQQVTEDYKEKINYILGDSSSSILRLEVDEIDFLYLDSANDANIVLNEYKAAKHFLHDNSIIVVDDVLKGNKGQLVGPEMKRDGWNVTTIDNDNGSYLCTKGII